MDRQTERSRPHDGTATLAVVYRAIRGTAVEAVADGAQAAIARSPQGVHPFVHIDPHLRVRGVIHPAGIVLGAQPLPVGCPQVIPQFPALLFGVNNGVGGK